MCLEVLSELLDAGNERDFHVGLHVERRERQIMLGRERREQPLLDRALGHEQINLDGALLSHAMGARDALLDQREHGRPLGEQHDLARLLGGGGSSAAMTATALANSMATDTWAAIKTPLNRLMEASDAWPDARATPTEPYA